MNDLNENLSSQKPNETDSKKHWNASLPYPAWPFGTVDGKELAKWGRKNVAPSATIDDYEEAPF